MFTGIVQNIGTLISSERSEYGKRFVVRSRETVGYLQQGESVSVNGVCQTVEQIDDDRFVFTAVGETLARTTLGNLLAGARVNLETAATPNTALGGHWVQGHVDGVGEVVSFETKGDDRLLEVSLPDIVSKLAASKGSITIDGVSLTIADIIGGDSVLITIIPHTLEQTIIGEYVDGRKVNVEADILGKYVMQYLERIHST